MIFLSVSEGSTGGGEVEEVGGVSLGGFTGGHFLLKHIWKPRGYVTPWKTQAHDFSGNRILSNTSQAPSVLATNQFHEPHPKFFPRYNPQTQFTSFLFCLYHPSFSFSSLSLSSPRLLSTPSLSLMLATLKLSETIWRKDTPLIWFLSKGQATLFNWGVLLDLCQSRLFSKSYLLGRRSW